MEVQYRELRSEDKNRWQELYESYLEFYETSFEQSAKDLVWERLLSGTIRGLAADAGGQVVGIAHFHFQTNTWSEIGHCYLEDLYVDPGHRGKGIARALIENIEEVAKSAGCSEMYWITRATNTTAQALYDQVATKTDFLRYEIKFDETDPSL
jgi:ribosomal protein S18 acetylase RimI-like enzyme